MSEVEQLYKRMQESVGGNVPWHTLPTGAQHQFTMSVNAIIQICSFKVATNAQ